MLAQHVLLLPQQMPSSNARTGQRQHGLCPGSGDDMQPTVNIKFVLTRNTLVLKSSVGVYVYRYSGIANIKIYWKITQYRTA